MILSSLNLQNFRSFKKKQIEFSSKTNLIIGPNAVGKTNILEAIYLLSSGKSFRASKEIEMIRYGEELARIKVVFSRSSSLSSATNLTRFSNRRRKNLVVSMKAKTPAVNMKTLSNLSPQREADKIDNIILEINLTTGEVQGKRTRGKLYKVNGVGKMWRDFAGILKVVLFRPEDINLILGSPSVRRNYLDSVLEQVDWQYRSCNLTYKKALRQRNKLLHEIRERPSFAKASEGKESQLIFWNQLLIKNGQVITHKREKLIEFYNKYFEGNRGNQGNLGIFYDKSVVSEKRLEKYAQAELALGATLVGPHRDDIIITNTKHQTPNTKQKRNIALYGSRGEQRMAVLYIKLAEMEFIKKKSNQQPILLLDDIFSELDKKHKKLVLEIINSSQTIITSTMLPKLPLDKSFKNVILLDY